MVTPSSSGTLPLRSWRIARQFVGARAWSYLFSLRERAFYTRRLWQLESVGLRPSRGRAEARVSSRLKFLEPDPRTLGRIVNAWEKLGVDKLDVGYAKTYASIVEALLDRPGEQIKVLEVGIFRGASLRGWREIFPESHVVGLDIDELTLFSEPGIDTFVADQLSVESLKSASEKFDGLLDLVIDDGWHQPEANVNTIAVFLRRLRPGEIFVVEDIHRLEYLRFWTRVINGLPTEFSGTIRRCGTHGIIAQSNLHKNSLVVIRRN